jgi:hypothetical protein
MTLKDLVGIVGGPTLAENLDMLDIFSLCLITTEAPQELVITVHIDNNMYPHSSVASITLQSYTYVVLRRID